MQSWKNNLTTKLSNPGIFVGKGLDKFYDITHKTINHEGSTVEVTMGRNSQTKRIQMIDFKLIDGEAVKDIHGWLNSYRSTLMGAQAHAIVGSEPTPLDYPSSQSPDPVNPGLADPHE